MCERRNCSNCVKASLSLILIGAWGAAAYASIKAFGDSDTVLEKAGYACFATAGILGALLNICRTAEACAPYFCVPFWHRAPQQEPAALDDNERLLRHTP